MERPLDVRNRERPERVADARAGVGGLHGVHGERANRIGTLASQGDGAWGGGDRREGSERKFRQRMATGSYAASAFLRRSTSRRIIGVKISCIASSIFPPGTTKVLARDMNESCSMLSR